jgi:hypothetical protein
MISFENIVTAIQSMEKSIDLRNLNKKTKFRKLAVEEIISYRPTRK